MVTLFTAMRAALLVAERDDRGTWTARQRLDGDGVEPECVAATGSTVFCGTFDDGLYRSTDGGESFERVGEETVGERVTSLSVGPDGTVWAGTEPSAVYRSGDDGETWTEKEGLTDLPSASEWSFPPRPHTHHVRWIEPTPDDPDHLYVGIEAGGLVQTRDGGETWEDRVPGARRDNHSLTTHPDVPERAWAAAGDGYAETDDGGATWDHPQDGLGHRYCWSVAVDPGDPDTVLLSSASGPRSAHNADAAESYVYRKRDEEWARLDGLPTGEGVLRAVLAAGSDAGEAYAANNRGLFRTGDAGTTWSRLSVDWPAAFESRTVRGLAVVD
ncbi:WD40/YVTN/BNR-like repeat-containing protein [Halomicrococcus sp. SG-WS-1]|uniref:WD40/YVTN/BNR-like repeat-containing protein n=1 Tax=Halomicrococcus sp. SG-WS-1 TaxID=3439057 RepID=UPI003F7A8424